MISKYKIIWSPKAKQDLQSIDFYICNILNQKNVAKSIIKRILKSISKLSILPERYARINILNKNIRKININNYITLYAVNQTNKEIYILHIFHSKENYFNKL